MNPTLTPLPYELDALDPFFSPETLKYHHGGHQKAYVEKLTQLLQEANVPPETTLTDLVRSASGMLFNQAAQIWNHEFFWTCLAPPATQGHPTALEAFLSPKYKDLVDFKQQLRQSALSHFGSGWLWIWVEKDQKGLQHTTADNANNPLKEGITPVACIDLWEHAHYIDYRNNKSAYFEAIWHTLAWETIRARAQNQGELED